jgi:hypothetical protein
MSTAAFGEGGRLPAHLGCAGTRDGVVTREEVEDLAERDAT